MRPSAASRARLVEVLGKAPRHAFPPRNQANRLNRILTTASSSKAGSHHFGTTFASACLHDEAKLENYHASLAKDFYSVRMCN
jgi:hypothetical protein